jgi:general secretion pathway protein D
MVKTRPGQTVAVETILEFSYPIAYEIPQIKKLKLGNPDPSASSYPVTPTTPLAFGHRNLGTELKLTPKLRGPYIEISGSLKVTMLSGFGRGAGEPFSPIVEAGSGVVLTDNKVLLPHFTTEEYEIHSIGLPGMEHVIKFDKLQFHLTCKTE